MSNNNYHQLQVLEILDEEPDITQADLAARVGLAVGTVNWYLKRWSAKGMIKIKRINRWRWNYILTPEGVTEKTRLARKYLEFSMTVYRRTRESARNILGEVLEAGYSCVMVDSDDDLADIFVLTCLEMGVECLPMNDAFSVPVVIINGTQFVLKMPETTGAEK